MSAIYIPGPEPGTIRVCHVSSTHPRYVIEDVREEQLYAAASRPYATPSRNDLRIDTGKESDRDQLSPVSVSATTV